MKVYNQFITARKYVNVGPASKFLFSQNFAANKHNFSTWINLALSGREIQIRLQKGYEP